MPKLFKSFDYGTVPNSYDILKAIALLTMVVDHVGNYLFPEILWFRVAGRIAFPIFLFLVGYSGVYRFNPWLLAGALAIWISAYITGFPLLPLNILFAILLWRAVMGWLNSRPHILNDTFMLWVAMLVFYVPTMILVEYGTLGLMFAVLGWYARTGRDDKATRAAWGFTFALSLMIQIYAFGLGAAHSAVYIFESIFLFIALHQFNMRPMAVPLLGYPILLTARNTLPLYVLHVIALQVIASTL